MGVWKPQLGKWKDFPERQALLLFAQSVVELLFHHTADSFRARSLNLHGLVRECTTAVREVINGSAPEGVMEPLLEELVHRIGNTSVFGKLKPGFFNEYQAKLGDKKKRNPRELSLTLSALRAELEATYWPAICSAIRNEIANGKPTQRIIDLADTFLSEAERRGWDRQAIFSKTKWHFFFSRHDPSVIDGIGALESYLNTFSQDKKKDFVCVFRATDDIGDAQEVLSKANIELHETAPIQVPTDGRSQSFLAPSNSLPKYVFARGISALEGVSARRDAERRLQFIVNMYRFQRHEYHPKWSDSALIYDSTTMERFLIQRPNSPMLVGNTMRTALGKVSADDLTSIFMSEQLSRASASTLFALLEYHRAAIDAPTPENQLLNLWAGIEGMVPTPFGDKARVLHFIDMIVPSLTLTYVEKHVRYLIESYTTHDSAVMNFIGGKGIGDDDFQKCASLLCCAELTQERGELLDLLSTSPLLRLRTEAIVAKLANPRALKENLERRRLWICWHLQRIYATRNRIVHNARSMHYLHSVVENLHAYFDCVVCSVIQFARSRRQANTVGAALQALRVHESAYLKSLDVKVGFTIEHFRDQLFGTNSPLNPT